MDDSLYLECQLETELDQYKGQLAALEETLSQGDSIEEDGRRDVLMLRNSLQELIKITEERLFDAKKQNLLLALDGHLRTEEATTKEVSSDAACPSTDVAGNRCCVPLDQSWGAAGLHNAIILCEEPTDDGLHEVRVLFLNPLFNKMKTCQFFLNGKCKFSEDECRYCHGYVVERSKIQPYNEPDHSSLAPGVMCLARDASDSLWKRAIVTDLAEDKVSIEYEGHSETVNLEYHNVLPIGTESNLQESSSEASSDSEDNPEDAGLRLIASHKTELEDMTFGEWEEHTKGIGSKLLAKMGYIRGQGLGKDGEGRIDPVDIIILPQGKSLDACVELREHGKLKKMDDSKRSTKTTMRKGGVSTGSAEQVDTFEFLNTIILNKDPNSRNEMERKVDKRANLNLQLYKVEGEISAIQESLKRLQEQQFRNKGDVSFEGHIKDKSEALKSKLLHLSNQEKSLQLAISNKRQHKVLTKF